MSKANSYSARTDENQKSLIRAGLKFGIGMEVIKQPVDLVLCVRGQTIMAEVKNPAVPPSSRRLTDKEYEFYDKWPGIFVVIMTPNDLLKLLKSEDLKITCHVMMVDYFNGNYTENKLKGLRLPYLGTYTRVVKSS